MKGLSNHEHIAPSAGLSLVRLSFCTFLLLDTFLSVTLCLLCGHKRLDECVCCLSIEGQSVAE